MPAFQSKHINSLPLSFFNILFFQPGIHQLLVCPVVLLFTFGHAH